MSASVTFWKIRSVTMSLAWTSMVMRAVMMLRCKMGSSPLTKAARALSLWTHEDRQTYRQTATGSKSALKA